MWNLNGTGTTLEKGGPDKSLLLPLAETGTQNRGLFGDGEKCTVSLVGGGRDEKSEFPRAEGSPWPGLFPQKHKAQRKPLGV